LHSNSTLESSIFWSPICMANISQCRACCHRNLYPAFHQSILLFFRSPFSSGSPLNCRHLCAVLLTSLLASFLGAQYCLHFADCRLLLLFYVLFLEHFQQNTLRFSFLQQLRCAFKWHLKYLSWVFAQNFINAVSVQSVLHIFTSSINLNVYYRSNFHLMYALHLLKYVYASPAAYTWYLTVAQHEAKLRILSEQNMSKYILQCAVLSQQIL